MEMFSSSALKVKIPSPAGLQVMRPVHIQALPLLRSLSSSSLMNHFHFAQQKRPGRGHKALWNCMDVNRSTSERLEAPGPLHLPSSLLWGVPHPTAISTYSWQEKPGIQVPLVCLREGFGAAVDGERQAGLGQSTSETWPASLRAAFLHFSCSFNRWIQT